MSCGSSVGYYTENVTLMCNTSSSITELHWGVKSALEPNPVLIIIDPSGERPGGDIASTNYGGRVFFVGNITTGNASVEIRNLTASDGKEYLWKIDHGGGGGYKKYVMSLTVKPGKYACSSLFCKSVSVMKINSFLNGTKKIYAYCLHVQ